MSQNKTKIQGLEPNEQQYSGGGYAPNQSFYTPNGASSSRSRGTVVPGMSRPAENSGPYTSAQQPTAEKVRDGKPVVGFLYSISRTAMGEYWPLYVGRNTIGQNPSSDIVLGEATVSNDHAVLVVRMKKPSGEVIAAVKDSASTNGTLLNGESIDFETVECHNGDVITIGNNYELVVVLLDAAKMGLSVSESFIRVIGEEEDYYTGTTEQNYQASQQADSSQRGTRPGGFSPFNDGPTSWGPGSEPMGGTYSYGPSQGTVGMDGSTGNNHGGTIPV